LYQNQTTKIHKQNTKQTERQERAGQNKTTQTDIHLHRHRSQRRKTANTRVSLLQQTHIDNCE